MACAGGLVRPRLSLVRPLEVRCLITAPAYVAVTISVYF
jgi:hypothetical protein